ncbi:CPCC family cysteine-rich protein [Streptomyces sp. V4-01]|uniref:CPCC family cysteine-rich protein n=1 Tax=Actinacidiphila polyblastidii TaxID=3110430 RepID=A0ABU7PK91_9ACTN|nr:CPCC family cysteine-rich protein [Streptomyces sp. V4-01]
MDVKYSCVSHGRLTMDGPPGSYEICPVCFWEDDQVQLRWPDWAIGANPRTSLIAQRNFEAFGASHERFLEHVRPPTEDEPLDRSWRPIDPDRDRFEPQGVQLAAWPDDRTVLYWWRYRNPGFWRPPLDDRAS